MYKGATMGFNSYYVDLCVNNKTINRYEKLGYIMPKKFNEKKKKIVYDTSQTIKVRVNDLPQGSGAIIDYSCDNCGRKIDVEWRRYFIYNLDGKYYCKDCKHDNPKFIKRLKPRNKISKSRSSSDYNIFIRTVLKRDNYSCRCCGVKSKNGNLEVHHLNGYQWFIEGRTDPANGITLCVKCHDNFHTLYGKIRNTKEQFEEWIDQKLENLNKYDKITEFPKVYCIEDDIIYESIYDCAKMLNCSSSYIYQICHGTRYTYKGKHYVYYDKYNNMTTEEINSLLSSNHSYKKIINLEFGNLFNSTKEACNVYSIKSDKNMSACCNKRRKHSGKYNGIYLSWIWYEDYIKLLNNEKIDLIEEHLETLERESFLMQQYNLFKH